MDNFKLNNGVEIPSVGLGTWLIENGKVADVIKMRLVLDIDILIQLKLMKMRKVLAKVLKLAE